MEIPDLLFGVATSDHQAEAFDPNECDCRDEWEKRPGQTPRGRATDFWNRYTEDIRLARELGCKIFRFSISWARVEKWRDKFSWEALDHYREVVSSILEADMVPLVTLHHLTWPIHVNTISPDFPERFVKYVEKVVERIGQNVPYWITFNEPNLLAYGYIKPWWQRDFLIPPGYGEATALTKKLENISVLIRNLFVAHSRARVLIKANNSAAKVGSNPFVLGLPFWMQKLLDCLAISVRNEEQFKNKTRGIAERRLATKTSVDLVIGHLKYRPARSEKVSYSKPYSCSQYLLVKRHSNISNIKDLAGRRVGFVRRLIKDQAASQVAVKAIPQVYESHAEALTALETGLVDGVVSDEETLEEAGMPQTVGYSAHLLKRETYHIGVARGNPDLLAVVNSAISEKPLSAGIGCVEGGPIERIRERGVLRVGIRGNEAPANAISNRERKIASAVAGIVLGDEKKIKFVPLGMGKHVKALMPWYEFLDPFLRGLAVSTTVINSNWWHLGMRGKLPEFLCPKHCIGQEDFVGLDYYWGINDLEFHRIYQLLEATMSNFSSAPVDPPGLLRNLKRLHRWFPASEILIIENGCINVADGFTRAKYLKAHLAQVEKARLNGIPLAAYICWSITSNREWNLPFSPASDFGLYNIRLDTDPTLERRNTDSAETYKKIIRQMNTAGF
jgi:beta-glucosidase/6-phospho-beta-glucosidase/beta-galactosidase